MVTPPALRLFSARAKGLECCVLILGVASWSILLGGRRYFAALEPNDERPLLALALFFAGLGFSALGIVVGLATVEHRGCLGVPTASCIAWWAYVGFDLFAQVSH